MTDVTKFLITRFTMNKASKFTILAKEESDNDNFNSRLSYTSIYMKP